MADDIRIKYGSTGFEKVRAEALEIQRHASALAQAFTPVKKEAQDAEHGITSFFSKIDLNASRAVSGLGTLALEVTAVGTAVGGLVALIGGAGVAAFTAWTGSMLKTTEGFRQMEISLYGALKSWDAVEKVSKFAKEYAAEYPAMYGDVMRSMQSLAFIPSLKPALMKGDVDQMKEFMHVVQGMMTMRPEQGVTGSIWALREALAGNWRSLQMRFDVPVHSIAKSAGMTMEEMKENPQQAMKALKAWINEFVGADTMAMAAKNLSIQIGNLKDKYDIWIDKLGKSGIYQKVVDYLLKMNDALQSFMASDKVAKWTDQLNSFLENVVDRIAGVFTKGIDWGNIDSLSGLVEAFKKVGSNAMEELKKVWEQAKEPLAGALKEVMTVVAKAGVEVFKSVMLPAIEESIKAAYGAFNKMAETNPKEAAMAATGAGAVLGGSVGGPVGALVGGTAGFGYSTYKSFMADPAENAKIVKDFWIGQVKDFGSKVFSAEWWGKQGEEVKSWFVKKKDEATGAMAMAAKEPVAGKETFGKWRMLESRGMAKAPAEKEVPAWAPSGEQMLSHYQAWARMAGMMAKREEGNSPFDQFMARERERKGMREKWETGELSTEDWRKYLQGEEKKDVTRSRMGMFETQREGMLNDILAKTAGKTGDKSYGLQSKVYGEMFNIAYQKGDFGKAQEYMNKSLEAMLKQMEKEEKRGDEDNKSLKTIADYAVVAKKKLETDNTRVGPDKYSNLSGPERGDELRESVTRDQVQ